MILLKERFLHGILYGLDIHDALVALCQRLFHAAYHGFDVHIVLARGGGRQRHGAENEFAVVIDDVAVALSHLHGLLLPFRIPLARNAQKTQHLVFEIQMSHNILDYSTLRQGSQRTER